MGNEETKSLVFSFFNYKLAVEYWKCASSWHLKLKFAVLGIHFYVEVFKIYNALHTLSWLFALYVPEFRMGK